MNKKTALITGASSGIGTSFAKLLAQKGYDLILTARRESRLNSLATELTQTYGVTAKPLVADLADPASAQRIYNQTQAWDMDVDLLINNAGFGVYETFHESNEANNTAMIQVMITSLTELTRLFVKPMVSRNQGGILNVASIGAEIPGLGLAVYAAAKSYVVHFTDILSMELDGTNVTATALLPGATRTEWMEVAGIESTEALEKFTMDSMPVAKEGYNALQNGKVKHIAGRMNRIQMCIMKKLPRCCVKKILKMYLK